MKCDKCGYSDNGTGDWAHVCGPVKVKSYEEVDRFEEQIAKEILAERNVVNLEEFRRKKNET
jgi:hypothetical protein